jgi:hypothetical protein
MFVYLAGPITPSNGFTREDNAASAIKVYLELVQSGVPAFCPQLTILVPSHFDVDYEEWLRFDFAIIDLCTHVLMLPRWGTSAGARRELAYAEARGKIILYEVPKTWTL